MRSHKEPNRMAIEKDFSAWTCLNQKGFLPRRKNRLPKPRKFLLLTSPILFPRLLENFFLITSTAAHPEVTTYDSYRYFVTKGIPYFYYRSIQNFFSASEESNLLRDDGIRSSMIAFEETLTKKVRALQNTYYNAYTGPRFLSFILCQRSMTRVSKLQLAFIA